MNRNKDYSQSDLLTEFEKELELLTREGLKYHPLRLEYENKVRMLESEKLHLYSNKYSDEEVARILHDRRRQLGLEFKEAAPPLFCQYIFYETEKKYGDPLGPDFDTLKKTKTDIQIIESASRPIRNLDDRLTIDGFKKWFSETYHQYVKDGI